MVKTLAKRKIWLIGALRDRCGARARDVAIAKKHLIVKRRQWGQGCLRDHFTDRGRRGPGGGRAARACKVIENMRGHGGLCIVWCLRVRRHSMTLRVRLGFDSLSTRMRRILLNLINNCIYEEMNHCINQLKNVNNVKHVSVNMLISYSMNSDLYS